MPLINIRCKPKFCPTNTGTGTKAQHGTERFGSALPQLMVDNEAKLCMDAGTPPTGVQVDYERFHAKAVNAPERWIVVKFSEEYPGKKKGKKVALRLKAIFDAWYDANNLPIPSTAMDVFWGPTHGYVNLGDGDEHLAW